MFYIMVFSGFSFFFSSRDFIKTESNQNSACEFKSYKSNKLILWS